MPDKILPRWVVAFPAVASAWTASRARRLLLAVLCVLVAAALRLAMQPLVGERLFFTTFFPAIALAAALAGLVPGLVATALSGVLAWFLFLPPTFAASWSAEALLQLGFFLVAALCLVAVAAALHSALGLLIRQRDLVIEERARQVQAHELLVRELDHRLRNMVGLVGTIAVRSLQGGLPPDEARAVFNARLQALAQASESPQAGGQPVADLLERQLRAYADQVAIVRCESVRLSGEAAQRLALIVHELATNAAKYGALSSRQGRVEVSCSVEGAPPSIVFRWRESGGPPVAAPGQAGFGTMVLVRAPEYAGGTVSVDYAPDGLRYLYSMPLADRVGEERAAR